MSHSSNNSILVIGVDSHFCYLMRRYVAESAHPLLFSAPDEQAVIAVAMSEKPALIIMEAGPFSIYSRTILPGLRSNKFTACIPVVVCSWQGETDGHFNARADIHLQMPVLYGDFLHVLSRLGI